MERHQHHPDILIQLESRMSFIPETPKLMSYYQNKMMKNFYQPFYDAVNAQSMWVDVFSNWFTDSNKHTINAINEKIQKTTGAAGS